MSTLDPETMNALGKKVEEESDLRLNWRWVNKYEDSVLVTLSIMTAGSEHREIFPTILRCDGI